MAELSCADDGYLRCLRHAFHFQIGGFSTSSVLNQSHSSDQWSYYQAKGIKSYLYQMQIEKMELELQGFSKPGTKDIQDIYRKKMSDYKSRVAKYEEEKAEIERTARQLETMRDAAQRHSKSFGVAVIYLQIAILPSSIADLLKQKLVWYGGLFTGAVGMLYFADGFLVFI